MNKILLSTTNTLEGWEITEYLGTISSNAVIGANVLSDIAASWTDFFGGRSGSYEKRLQQIYKEALSALENKASDVGANCVVGLHIDIDEISEYSGESTPSVPDESTPVIASIICAATPLDFEVSDFFSSS